MKAPRPAEAAIPADAVAYSRTALFTEETVPSALLRAHNTKAGVWGAIRVTEGALIYRVTDPRRARRETVLVPGAAPGVVEPTILHEVEPAGSVSFFVEFYRRPSEPA